MLSCIFSPKPKNLPAKNSLFYFCTFWFDCAPSSFNPICFFVSNWENSESLRTFRLLKEQQIPLSVGTGLNSLVQSTSFPCIRHFLRRYSDSVVLLSLLLWHGKLECQSKLNKKLKFLPISSEGKFAFVVFFITSSINLRFARLVLFRNTSIIGRGCVVFDGVWLFRVDMGPSHLMSFVSSIVNFCVSKEHWFRGVPSNT